MVQFLSPLQVAGKAPLCQAVLLPGGSHLPSGLTLLNSHVHLPSWHNRGKEQRGGRKGDGGGLAIGTVEKSPLPWPGTE